MAEINPIRFISTSTVRPASCDHVRRIELTPSDHISLPYSCIRRGLLFHKPLSNTIHIVERMKEALSRALGIFFPLAGRLAEIKDNDDTQTTSFFVDCNDEGALFVHAVVDSVTVGDILAEVVTVSDEKGCFFLMSRTLNFEAVGYKLPLLAVQVTELVDGVFVACTMNHFVADETTFWHFVNVWSKICRCGDDLLPLQHSNFPVFGREYLDRVVDLPLCVPISFLKTRFPPAMTLQSRVVHFSKERIAELKEKANSGNTGSCTISSLQAVMAHLWVCVTRSRRLSPQTLVFYSVAVGLRPRLQPPLSEFYFGNAVIPAVVRATAGQLLELGTGWAAQEMNRAIEAQTSDKAMNFIKGWAVTLQKSLESMTQDVPTAVMFTGSSPRFDVYCNDFGWGKPVALRTGICNYFDGEAPVFPGPEEGSFDFTLFLSPETFRVLANDTEFAGTLN